MDEILGVGVPEKTYFLNCRFAKPAMRVCGLPLPERIFKKCVFFRDTKYFIHSPFLINHIPPPSFEISDTCHRAKLDHNNRPFIKIMICCKIHYVL